MSWATSWFFSFPHSIKLSIRLETSVRHSFGVIWATKKFEFFILFCGTLWFSLRFQHSKTEARSPKLLFSHIVWKRVLLNFLETAIKRKSIFVKVGIFCCVRSHIWKNLLKIENLEEFHQNLKNFAKVRIIVETLKKSKIETFYNNLKNFIKIWENFIEDLKIFTKNLTNLTIKIINFTINLRSLQKFVKYYQNLKLYPNVNKFCKKIEEHYKNLEIFIQKFT